MKKAEFISKQTVSRLLKKGLKRGKSQVEILDSLSKNPNAKLTKPQKTMLMKSKRKKYL